MPAKKKPRTSERPTRTSNRDLAEQNLYRFSSDPDDVGIRKHSNSVASRENKREGKICKIQEVQITVLGANDSQSCEQERETIVTGKLNGIFIRMRSPETKRAVNAARLYKPKNPAFMCILQLQDMRSMYVPGTFSNKYLYLHKNSKDKIKLWISDEKQWQMFLELFWKGRECLLLTDGWIAFLEDNDLSLGDVCIFELMDRKTVVFKASIFHATLT